MFMCCIRYSSKLGEQLADLHLYNKRQIEKQNKEQQTVGNVCVFFFIAFMEIFLVLLLFIIISVFKKGKGPGQSEVETANRFGFHVNTCCGYIPQVSTSALYAV